MHRVVGKHRFIKARVGIVCVATLFSFTIPLHADSGAEELTYRGFTTPFVIDFPVTHESRVIDAPNSQIASVYVFTGQVPRHGLTYAVTVARFAANSAPLNNRQARLLVEQNLRSQIEQVDQAMGTNSEVRRLVPSDIGTSPARSYLALRSSDPITFGRYLSFVHDRMLVSVWASGLDTVDNRERAADFLSSVEVTH